jgi:hypothetical protein
MASEQDDDDNIMEAEDELEDGQDGEDMEEFEASSGEEEDTTEGEITDTSMSA